MKVLLAEDSPAIQNQIRRILVLDKFVQFRRSQAAACPAMSPAP